MSINVLKLLAVFTFATLFFIYVSLYTKYIFLSRNKSSLSLLRRGLDGDDLIDFEDFDNENGSTTLIVPNIVHLIFLQQTSLRFHEMLCIFSIYLNQRPDLIMIHCENCSFHGQYWQRVEQVAGLRKLIRFHHLPVKRRIFGQTGPHILHHRYKSSLLSLSLKKRLPNCILFLSRGDYWRIALLMEYGGMYLDNDVFVINSLDTYRRFEMTAGLEDVGNSVMGSQVIVAHRNARFLRAWFDTYRSAYEKNVWYANAGRIPGKMIKEHPYLIHKVTDRFGKLHNVNLIIFVLFNCIFVQM